MNHLLHLEGHTVVFLVAPARRLTALHRCTMAYQDVTKRASGSVTRDLCDMDTNADIMYELLMKWRHPERTECKMWY